MRRPLKLCSHGGCARVVPGGTSRCDKHQARHEAQEKQRKAEYETRRPSSGDRGYDAAWRRCRRLFLAAHPKCCVPGCTLDATDVDHIQSVRDAPDLRLSWSNLRPMCHAHHSQRTGREQGGWSQGRSRQ